MEIPVRSSKLLNSGVKGPMTSNRSTPPITAKPWCAHPGDHYVTQGEELVPEKFHGSHGSGKKIVCTMCCTLHT
jgi:hypothetical protein